MNKLNFDVNNYKWQYDDEFVTMKNKYNSTIDFLKNIETYIQSAVHDISVNIEGIDFSDYATKDSPFFIGNPSVTTPEKYDSSERIANTQWVNNRVQEYTHLDSPTFSGMPTVPTPELNDNSAQIANTKWVKDMLTTYYAPLSSPKFTGTPKAPTPTISSNDTRIATTEFVHNKIEQMIRAYAPLDSPDFLGVPKAPTAPVGTNTNQIANTEFVNAQISNMIATAKTNLKETVITTGTAAHEEYIQPPDGFVASQCKFIVSLNSFNTFATGAKYSWDEHISVDEFGKVTCYVDTNTVNGSYTFSGIVNYLCIAQR